MIGVDTSFLVAWAIPDHPDHAQCRRLSAEGARQGRRFGLTLGILAEFIHVVTDPRRFQRPLSVVEAAQFADFWAQAEQVTLLQQDGAVSQHWLLWMTRHQLGRKRLLDTLIAATWHSAGITEIYTLNPADFTVFECFVVLPVRSNP